MPINDLQFHVKYAQVAELRQVMAHSTLVLLYVNPTKDRLISSQSSVRSTPLSFIHWVSKIDCLVVSIVVFGELDVDSDVDGVVGAIVEVLITLSFWLVIIIWSDVA